MKNAITVINKINLVFAKSSCLFLSLNLMTAGKKKTFESQLIFPTNDPFPEQLTFDLFIEQTKKKKNDIEWPRIKI